MKILKDKKVVISILIVTVLIIVVNSMITIKQCKIYQDKINIVIANIVGTISEKYPEVDEGKIVAILNMDKNSLKVGYNILEKYGINLDKISASEGIENQEKSFILINTISIVAFFVLIIIIFLVYSKNRVHSIF